MRIICVCFREGENNGEKSKKKNETELGIYK